MHFEKREVYSHDFKRFSSQIPLLQSLAKDSAYYIAFLQQEVIAQSIDNECCVWLKVYLRSLGNADVVVGLCMWILIAERLML
jgi:hypothetical protein